MTQTVEERILDMLKYGVGMKGYPVERVGLLTTWEGYDVYRFYLNVDENEFIQIGMPWFYLVKGDEITVSNFDQTLCIIEKVYDETYGPEDEEEDWEDEKEQGSVPEPVPCMISCAGPHI